MKLKPISLEKVCSSGFLAATDLTSVDGQGI